MQVPACAGMKDGVRRLQSAQARFCARRHGGCGRRGVQRRRRCMAGRRCADVAQRVPTRGG
eukprot:5347474-Alexandrium_andersonii.AAC.1